MGPEGTHVRAGGVFGWRGDDETTGGEETGAHLRARGQGGTSLREVERARETLRESGGCCSFEFNRVTRQQLTSRRSARGGGWSDDAGSRASHNFGKKPLCSR